MFMTVFKTSENIQKLFNAVASKYDFMNNIISLGLHKVVKKECAAELDIKAHDRVLDACCGTGDFAYFIKQKEPMAFVSGVDFSQNMLNIAKKRMLDTDFQLMDVTNLAFEDNTFDFVTMGFGLRNIANPEKALFEVYRVLKPGGKFLQLDFGCKNIFNKFFDFLTPLVAGIFTPNRGAYKYLIKSKKEFPEPDELIRDFQKIGFKFVKKKDFLFHTLSAQIMKK